MATADNIRSYVSAADMVDYWINNVAPRYFNMDNANTYRAGTLGLIMDIMGTTTEDTANAMMIARREFYPNTAQYMKSLYRHAAGRFMDAPMAIPATANILLMIQQSDILKYGETTGDLHTFVLDDTFLSCWTIRSRFYPHRKRTASMLIQLTMTSILTILFPSLRRGICQIRS